MYVHTHTYTHTAQSCCFCGLVSCVCILKQRVRACVRSCVHACVRACVHAFMRSCDSVPSPFSSSGT